MAEKGNEELPVAQGYGVTDLDGSRPEARRYIRDVRDAGKPADATGR
jgi:hypothetical protein